MSFFLVRKDKAFKVQHHDCNICFLSLNYLFFYFLSDRIEAFLYPSVFKIWLTKNWNRKTRCGGATYCNNSALNNLCQQLYVWESILFSIRISVCETRANEHLPITTFKHFVMIRWLLVSPLRVLFFFCFVFKFVAVHTIKNSCKIPAAQQFKCTCKYTSWAGPLVFRDRETKGTSPNMTSWYSFTFFLCSSWTSQEKKKNTLFLVFWSLALSDERG